MAMPHMVMKHWDPMIGCDVHLAVAPTGPPIGPPGPYPYFTMQFLSGLLVFFTPLKSQRSLYGITVAKGSDIGGGIPHVGAPSADLPVTILTSGSKNHFGANNYQVDGKPVGLALLGAVNLNLNCGTPVPTPSGYVVCVNVHAGGMTFADYLGGFATMVADFAIQSAFNHLGMRFGKLFDGKTGILGLVGNYGWTLLTFLVGTPLGPGLGNTNIFQDKDKSGWSPGGAAEGWVDNMAENVGRAMGDILDGEPPHLPKIPEIAKPDSKHLPKPSNLDLL